MLGGTVHLCQRCHSIRLVPLTYTERAWIGARELAIALPVAKCANCGRTFQARDFLVLMSPGID
jgi:hypothetical protein